MLVPETPTLGNVGGSSAPAFGMFGGKFPPPLIVTLSEPLVMLTKKLAAQVVFGAAWPSSGVPPPEGAVLSSVRRGNPLVVPTIVPSSVSKFLPVELSRFFWKLTLPSQVQSKNPPTEPRTVDVR